MEERLRELERSHFSANARSLYLELLWQFGGCGDCEEMYLSNKLLQERAGIRSSHSFDAAREELINAGMIKHKKQKYQISGNRTETERKPNGKGTENSAVIFPMEIKKITTTTTTEEPPRAREPAAAPIQGDGAANATDLTNAQGSLSTNSAEVRHEWFLWNNENLKGGDALELIQLENLYGAEKVVAAIHAAGCADRFGKLNINFVKKVLQRILNDGQTVTKTAKRKARKAEENSKKTEDEKAANYAGVDIF